MLLPSMRQVVGLCPEAICDIVKHSEMRNLKAQISDGYEYLAILQESCCLKDNRPGQGASVDDVASMM